jgi:hypothetical protein
MSLLYLIDEFEQGNDIPINYIDINNGLVNVNSFSGDELYVDVRADPGMYVASDKSTSLHWAVADLTCQEAQQNMTGYACASMNSMCLGVNSV